MSSGVFSGQVAIITGASSGIGLETARLFAREGALTVLAARREKELLMLKQEIENAGGRAEVAPTDVTRKEHIYELVRGTHQRHGRLDILVNNAGIGGVHVFLEMTDEDVQRMIDVNFMAVVWSCRAALPIMVKQGFGHIVNVSSVNALKGMPYSTVYSGTKFGLRGLTEALRLELHGSGVSLSSVHPGFTDTAMAQSVVAHFHSRGEKVAGANMMMSPARVGRAIRDAVVKDKAEITLTAGGIALAVVNRISTSLANWMVRSFGPRPEIPEHLRPR